MLNLNSGYFIMLLGLAAYIVVAVTLAGFLPDHWAVQILYALVAGMAWIYPAVKFLDFSYRKQQDKKATIAKEDHPSQD
ncbi:DUF2842 domain-containing protein [Kiloniella sp. b19]|uniref:DUF2842 domain-containing protein n=1 Tax=Kiloniella sp. GXU_MW_B19 TaxID=3141326 RepID=UPI0031DCD249